jgi:hypothetical protein
MNRIREHIHLSKTDSPSARQGSARKIIHQGRKLCKKPVSGINEPSQNAMLNKKRFSSAGKSRYPTGIQREPGRRADYGVHVLKDLYLLCKEALTAPAFMVKRK